MLNDDNEDVAQAALSSGLGLTGKFHSHLTVEADPDRPVEAAAKLVAGKPAIIANQRLDGSERQDWLITHHYVTGYHDLTDHTGIIIRLQSHAAALTGAGYRVVRVKLEHEMLDTRSDPAQIERSLRNQYTEVHMKCSAAGMVVESAAGIAAAYGWHCSQNRTGMSGTLEPTVVQLLTRRYHPKPGRPLQIDNIRADIDYLRAAFKAIKAVARVSITEVKCESAVCDSNEGLDDWWMGKQV